MRTRRIIVLFLSLSGIGAIAQNTVTSTLAVGSSGSQFTVTSNGTADITTPMAGPLLQLHQSGSSYGSAVGTPALLFATDDSLGTSNYFISGTIPGVTTFFVRADGTAYYAGNVAIGTSSPNAQLTVFGPALGSIAGNTVILASLQNAVGNHSYINFSEIRTSPGTDWTTATTRIQQMIDITNQGYIDFNPIAGTYGMALGTGNTELVRFSGNGNVGIGTTSPGSKLEIDGSVKLTAGSGASLTFQDGSVQSVAWNGILSGGDYAESVDVTGERAEYEPGDILVVDPEQDGKFVRSSDPYSTLVTGVYSTRPGVVGRRQKTDKTNMNKEVPMAMTGIVPIKVSAENGAIHRGDLLVTSSVPGVAMKGTDRSRMLGAVIGKSLGQLQDGAGTIEAVITLQ